MMAAAFFAPVVHACVQGHPACTRGCVEGMWRASDVLKRCQVIAHASRTMQTCSCWRTGVDASSVRYVSSDICILCVADAMLEEASSWWHLRNREFFFQIHVMVDLLICADSMVAVDSGKANLHSLCQSRTGCACACASQRWHQECWLAI